MGKRREEVATRIGRGGGRRLFFELSGGGVSGYKKTPAQFLQTQSILLIMRERTLVRSRVREMIGCSGDARPKEPTDLSKL